ncbi:hypothetical protein EWM64_g10657 [Hericium alpestre]|uniref:Essential protein Yae1 N-terminal domain-containing protein n=1 Tax=Hericium alpestre TaxID=135208 RepID=A0A4Y9ZF24_9AGAM|nr:hypothetical protein EWM64_g10657 [Hericium alpestre]
MPAPGFEPRKPQEAAVLLFEEPDGKLLNPVHLKEIVAMALCDSHAAGLKEGQNAGFCEGLEAEKKKGRAEGREEGLQEGLERSRLEASQDACTASPIPHPPFAATPRVLSIDVIDEQLLHEICFTAYNSGFKDGFALSDKELESAQSMGYTKGYRDYSAINHLTGGCSVTDLLPVYT